ncbi:hypothetical protein [Planococcus shenhongbingii]|uniref:hypothetical protein n=1 Tax=Planococcus shenhongbingii TaxID=3058398 RepID=UPI003462A701
MAIKVAAVIGSVRQDSMNLRLVEFMKKRYADRLDIEPVTIFHYLIRMLKKM